ncbi:hypothetical protein [Sediminibacter sp. Hel_I_10]|uniref:hypothetical protein n=1 Tax=Sediminibacter sp. Hel_I_10 TaxID=1392490 RepID=UPI0012DC9629|nr:hypothetical protein [Sediminibacter sp. Hel_I_10]
MVDGSEKSGFAPLPSNKLFKKNIPYRDTEKGKSQKIDSDNIYRIIVTVENEEYLFERGTVINVTKNFYNKEIDCSSRNKIWMLATYYSKNIILYFGAQSYIVKKGKVVSTTIDNSGTWAEIFLLVKRPSENCIAKLGAFTSGAKIIGEESSFRKASKVYFKDNSTLVDRIDNKEFKIDDIRNLVKAYDDLVN